MGAFDRYGSVCSYNCIGLHNSNKLNKTNILLAKISRELKNSGIDTSRPSRDPSRSFKFQHRFQNSRLGLLCCLLVCSCFKLDIEHDEMLKALLIKQQTE